MTTEEDENDGFSEILSEKRVRLLTNPTSNNFDEINLLLTDIATKKDAIELCDALDTDIRYRTSPSEANLLVSNISYVVQELSMIRKNERLKKSHLLRNLEDESFNSFGLTDTERLFCAINGDKRFEKERRKLILDRISLICNGSKVLDYLELLNGRLLTNHIAEINSIFDLNRNFLSTLQIEEQDRTLRIKRDSLFHSFKDDLNTNINKVEGIFQVAKTVDSIEKLEYFLSVFMSSKNEFIRYEPFVFQLPGSFNPVHIGHENLFEKILNSVSVSEPNKKLLVWTFLLNPRKPGLFNNYPERILQLQLAGLEKNNVIILDIAGSSVSTRQREQMSTFASMAKEEGNINHVFGHDNMISKVDSAYGGNESSISLLTNKKSTIFVSKRSGITPEQNSAVERAVEYARSAYGTKIRLLDDQTLEDDVSATMIRDLIRRNEIRVLEKLLTPEVLDMILNRLGEV